MILNKVSYILKVVTFILLLASLIYSGFFLEKGKFFNNTRVEIEKTELAIIDAKTTINAINKKLDRLRKNGLPSNLEMQNEIKTLESEHDIIYEKYNNLDYKIGLLDEKELSRSKNGHYDNIYHLIRALSLGALGAMLTLITSSSLRVKTDYHYESLFLNKAYWDLMISSNLSGALISIVVFSMFYSNQLSVFPMEEIGGSKEPSFWRSTLVCLIAGAFAEKIYQALSGRISTYTEQADTHNKSSKADAEKRAAS